MHSQLIQVEKDIQKSHRSSGEYEEDKAAETIGNNPKDFFTYVKKKSKVKSKIGPLADKNRKLTGKKQRDG